MATVEDSFHADLDELSDNEVEVDAGKPEDMYMDDDDIDSVSKLQKTQRYADIMQKVELEDDHDDQYKLIVDCNQLSVDIENEIVIIHNFIRDKYRLKFQELDSLVHDPINYARVVKKIGNETDDVDLQGLLPKSTIIALSSTTKGFGNPLPDDILQKTLDACDRALDLDSVRNKVLEFVESKMASIAPNLSAVVGAAVAAKLMATAGGLSTLANMPACDVQLIGHKRKNLVGFSTAAESRVGYLEQTEIFKSTPPGLCKRASRVLAAKSTLAARVDATRGDPQGKNGKAFREEILNKIQKWQEPSLASQPKPLPVPYSKPKKKRGGRRLRKMKERYQMTDMRKLANRMAFGTPEDTSLGGDGYGMLGRAGSTNSKLKLNAKVAKKLKERQYTSLLQGIELCNPQVLGLGSGTQSTYFSESSTFSILYKI